MEPAVSLTTQISPQVRSKETVKNALDLVTSLNNVMRIVALVQYTLLLLISFSMDRYWSLMNVMQIFVFYSLFDVSFTVPMTIFFKFLIKIATFEIVEMGNYF